MTPSHDVTREHWDALARKLQAPFDPREVDFRVQGKVNEASGRAQVVAYVDARTVQDRLDAVVGPGNWSFDWTPLVIDRGEVMVAKGTLTLHGVSKSDAGSASNFEQTLGAVSHCFKRAAVQWGVGRYLYSIESQWVPAEKGGRIADATLAALRAKLPRATAPVDSTPTAAGGTQAEAQRRTTNATATVQHGGRTVVRDTGEVVDARSQTHEGSEPNVFADEPVQPDALSWDALWARAERVRLSRDEFKDIALQETGKTKSYTSQDKRAISRYLTRMEETAARLTAEAAAEAGATDAPPEPDEQPENGDPEMLRRTPALAGGPLQ